MTAPQSISVRAASDGRIRAALKLARDALACDWVAIAHPHVGSRLVVLDSSSDRELRGMELSNPAESLVAGGLVDTAGAGLLSAWTLVCDRRPALVWIGPIPDTGWVLLAAFADIHVLDHPCLALVVEHVNAVLAGLFLADERARVEQIAAERVGELIGHMDLPVVFLDSRESTVFVNAAARDLLALPQDAPTAAQVAAAMRQVFADLPSADGNAGLDMFADNRLPLQIGDRHWELLARRIDSHAVSGWLWLFNDNTAVIGQQRMIMESRRAETMARIIGGVAHQFNNLLTVVLGGAEAVSDAHDLAPHLREALGQVVAAADRGASIVAQLRAFGQRGAAAGQARQSFALAPALHGMLPILQGLVPEPAHLILEPVDDTLIAQADSALFPEVIANLVLNAREAISDDGMITVSAVPVALAQEQSSARALAFRDAVVIRVRDNGAGMEPADCSRAFEPFFTTRGMASARGLGLSVVEGWARNAGGMARIESAIGQGTVVEIVLPRQRAEQGAGDAVQCPDGRGAS